MLSDKKNIDLLLELYFSKALTTDAADIVRGWLLSDDEGGLRNAAMREFFDGLTLNRPAPDSYTTTSLARLHDELGFTDRRIPSLEGERKNVRRRVFGFVAGAAAALFAAALLLPDLVEHPAPLPQQTVVAATDDTITLPDGSTVELRSGAGLSYDESGFASRRAVTLSGEGFFTVVHDEKRPFTVTAGGATVTVLGTEFGVRAWESESTTEVVLSSGSVEVSAGGNSVTLEPMQRARIDRLRGTITSEDVDEIEMSRLRGLNLSLEDITLKDALVKAGGFFGVAMRIAADLPDTPGIVLNLEDDATLDDALFMLSSVTGSFDYSISRDTVTITSR